MTELGIKCSLVYLQVYKQLALFPYFFFLKIHNLPYTWLFTVCNIIMTGEPTH